MSLTIDPSITASVISGMSPEQAAVLYKSLCGTRAEITDLMQALRKNPMRAIHNPKMRRILSILRQMPGPRDIQTRIRMLRVHLSTLAQSLRKQMSPESRLPEAAAQQYGSDVGAEIEKILRDPNLSLEEKLMMLATALASKLENDIEAKMEEWGKLCSGSNGGSGGQLAQGLAGIAGNAIVPVVGGMVASQVAGMLTGGQGMSQDDKNSKSRQLETQIQLLVQRLNRMTSMVSTLMQDDHRTKSAVIANMRV